MNDKVLFGLTLRQMYKLAALQAMQLTDGPTERDIEATAAAAGAYADAAMLEDERAEKRTA